MDASIAKEAVSTQHSAGKVRCLFGTAEEAAEKVFFETNCILQGLLKPNTC